MHPEQGFLQKKVKFIILVALVFCLIHYKQCLSANASENSDQTKLELDSTEGDEYDLSGSDQIYSSDDDIFFLLEEHTVSIASKRAEKASQAPSIVTVITAEEIENIGARKLTDILRVVPGIDIIQDSTFGEIDIGVRGVRFSNSKIKLLIDGHSVTQPFNEDISTFFDDLPLKNVKKIEIIRGPGSALYGRSAFLAVINIITKGVADIDGIEVNSGFGSFDTQEYGILYGKNLYGIDITGFANFYNTNGLSDTIKEDLLSPIPFFNRFSVTPGDTDDSRNRLDLHLKLNYNNIELKAMYMNKDTEPFVGPFSTLTNDSESLLNYVTGELSYKLDLGERLTVHPRVYYDQYDFDFLADISPDGFIIPLDLDRDGDIERFPDGVFFNAIATNRRVGGEIHLDYELFDNNVFTLGFNYEWERQDNVRSFANFDPENGASLGSFQNVSNKPALREAVRQIWSLYVQDKWDITDDFGLTIGIRHDHYDDFEGTTNPRIGLVWNLMEDVMTLKLLYGQAFRAPGFVELFTANNPVILGNPDLKPETIRTYEVGLGYKFMEDLSANVNYFFNVIRDEINFVAKPKERFLEPGQAIFDNLGGSNIQGIEFEVRADFGKGTYAFANYTYQDAESKGDPLPDVPKHKGNVGFNFGITKYLNANLHAFISDDRVRAEADPRDDSPGYGLINLTMIHRF